MPLYLPSTGSSSSGTTTSGGAQGIDGEDGQDSFILGLPGTAGPPGAAGAPGSQTLAILGFDGEDGDSTYAQGPTGPPGTAGSTGALVLLEQHTASSSATLDFTAFISSTYDDYLLELLNLVPATTDTAFQMRMGTGGGPTYDTGANYGWNIFIARAGGSAVTGAETGATSIGLNYGAGGTLGVSSSTNYGLSGHLRLFSPQSTALYKIVEGDVFYLDAEPFRIRALVGGSYQSTTAVTAVQFYFSSGNIAAGTIRVYGIAKT